MDGASCVSKLVVPDGNDSRKTISLSRLEMASAEETRCGACLSVGRDVAALRALRSTYDMLMEDFCHQHNSPSASSEGPLVCWECAALLARVSELKRRVQRGRLALQLQRSLVNKMKLPTDNAKLELHSLSRLNRSTKITYDFTYQYDIDQKEEPTFKTEKDISDDDDPYTDLNPIELQNSEYKYPFKFLPDEIEPKVFTENVSDEESLSRLTRIIDDTKYVIPKEDNAANRLNPDTVASVKKKCSVKKLGREKRSKSARKEKKRRRALAAEEEEKVDTKKTEWRCRVCGQTFVTRGKMTYHQRTVHAEPVLCNECGRVFSFKPTLEKHMLTHFGGVPQYPCAVCGKSFAGRAGIRSHMVHVHAAGGGERHRCEPCDLTFKTKYKYRTHIKWSKRHGGEGTERHECEKCHRRYKTKQRLFEHYSYQHLGKAAHKCTVCDKEISSLLGLQKHMKYVHEGLERPRTHVCETCGDAFKQVAMLRQHQYIHTGEKPYACDQCGATFRQKGSLYTHRRLVHLKIKRSSSGAQAPVQAPR